MTAKFGIRDTAISATVFGLVLLGLIYVDPEVRLRMTDLLSHAGVSSVGDRIGDLASALWVALRTQSIDNAPALVFVTVGTVLTLFMLKS